MPSPLSRTNLAGPSGPFKTNPHPFNRLQPLELSCLSFCNSHPLFSIACSLFSQNTGGGVPPGQPSTLPTLRLSDVLTGRRYFVRPLFSYSYKLLFPHPLYFDNHPRCRGCGVSVLIIPVPSGESRSNSFPCHTYKIVLLQVLSLPHIRKNGGVGTHSRYNPALGRKRGGYMRVIRQAWETARKTGLMGLTLAVFSCATLLCPQRAAAQATSSGLPSEMPGRIEPVTSSFDYVRRVEMIPMRDGVKLHTVILVPKGAKGTGILLTRTPYDADALTNHAASAHLGPTLSGYDNATEVILEGGYIRVVQDVRGKYGSEGDYVMTRPLHGPLNPTPVDHSTDTYDTNDCLVKNIPESNGRVGVLGISYDGFLPLMALVNPHSALKVSVPMNPMVDGWMGDDWFHNGAFRQQNLPYIYEQEATRKNEAKWGTSHFDDYDMFMQAGSAGELGRSRGLEQVGFWRKILEHPSYDAFWRDQAVDQVLAAQPLKVPVMLVHSLWDQEDIYGAMAVYKAIKPKDTNNDTVFLVMGPWHHGQEIEDGSRLGALRFNSDTALYLRQNILRPFLDHYLKTGAPKADVAPVSAFETGTNTWRRLPAWPAGCDRGCAVHPKPLYLTTGLKLDFTAPKSSDTAFEEYLSDPSKPAPFRARPIQPVGYGAGYTWSEWLVDDQREASGRPDVVAFASDILRAPVKIRGHTGAKLIRL